MRTYYKYAPDCGIRHCRVTLEKSVPNLRPFPLANVVPIPFSVNGVGIVHNKLQGI